MVAEVKAFLGHGPHHGEIGDRAIGDPHLRAIDDPILALPARDRFHVRRI
jgi:hypothetical protein